MNATRKVNTKPLNGRERREYRALLVMLKAGQNQASRMYCRAYNEFKSMKSKDRSFKKKILEILSHLDTFHYARCLDMKSALEVLDKSPDEVDAEAARNDMTNHSMGPWKDVCETLGKRKNSSNNVLCATESRITPENPQKH